MVSLQIECVVDARSLVGEGPVWDDATQVLWWTDIKGRVVHRYDPCTGMDTAFAMPVRVGCLALRDRGGLVLAAENGFWFWWPETGKLDHIVDVEADRPDNRMNDGGCDRHGRFIATSMNLAHDRQPTGACWRLNSALGTEKLADGLKIGNGVAFSPAGDRFYLADTAADRVWVHDYGPGRQAGGEQVGAPRMFLDSAHLAGKPDGAAVDAEGCYWLAGVLGGQLYCLAPDGRLIRTVELPVAAPTCPCFGGRDLDDLYLTSLGEHHDAPAGGLFLIRGLGVKGMPCTRFAG